MIVGSGSTAWSMRTPNSLYGVNSRVHSKECAGSRTRRLLALPAVVRMFGMAIRFQPGQQIANTAVRQRNARIGGAVVEVDGVPIRCQRIAARKHPVLNVAMTFIFRFRRKNPRIPANQAFFWLLKVEESQPQPVDGTRRRASNAVVNHQPAARRFNRRRG